MVPPAFNHASRAALASSGSAFSLEGQQRDGDAVGLRQARHHVAITTVIAMTAEDQPVLAGRVVGSRPLKSRFPARIISSNSVRPRLSAAAFFRAAAASGQMKWYTHGFFRHGPSCLSPSIQKLAQQIKQWGTELGFQQVGLPIPISAPANLNCRHGWINNTTARWNGWRATE